jgi:hypothetical protein
MSLTPLNLSAVSLTPVNSFLAVSLTPAINVRLFGYFLPVSTTPGSNFIAGVNDTAEKDSADNKTAISLAADGVIGTTMKRRIHRHPKRPD